MSLKPTTRKLLQESKQRQSWYPRKKGVTTTSRKFIAKVVKHGRRLPKIT